MVTVILPFLWKSTFLPYNINIYCIVTIFFIQTLESSSYQIYQVHNLNEVCWSSSYKEAEDNPNIYKKLEMMKQRAEDNTGKTFKVFITYS